MNNGKIRLIAQMKDVEGVEPETLVFQVLDGEYHTESDAKKAAKSMFFSGTELHTATIGDMFTVQGSIKPK